MDIGKLIEEVYQSEDEAKREENGKIIATDIMDGNQKLVNVVEALGPFLTSGEVQKRVVGMSFLGHILSSLRSDFLNEEELTFVVEFLTNRLKDQHLVIPKVILCILPVVQCVHLPEGSSVKLLRQLFLETNIQSHTHRHRRAFFLIIRHLLTNKLNEIKELGSDFVMSFLQAMDGEKDPRNLLLLFNIIPTVLTNFPIEYFTEDIFEVLSMYFPIDFNPIPGTPEAGIVTRERLADSLHLCLSQTNQFADSLVPLVLEKLEASVEDAKLDSLKLLEMCCNRSYTPEDLAPHLPSIWHALRREIFLGANEDVEKAANALIRSAFKCLSRNEEILETALNLIFSECKHHLSEPELRMSQPASRILCSATEGSAASCGRIISMTLPLLYEQFTLKTSNPERRGILGVMITMMSTINRFPSLSMSGLLENWDEILWMWFTLLTHSNEEFVLLSLMAFLVLIENCKERKNLPNQSSDLDEKSRNLLQEHLFSILSKTDEGNLSETTARVVYTLGELAKHFPDEFLKTSVPKFLKYIRIDGSSISGEESESCLTKSQWDCLASCSSAFSIAQVVVPELLKTLVELKERKEAYDPFVECLCRIVENGCIGPELKIFVDFLSVQLGDVVKLAIDARSNGKATLYIQLVGIARTIIRNSDASQQEKLIDIFWNERVAVIELKDLAKMNSIPGLVGEAILGSLRPFIRISKKEELVDLILEKVFLNNSEEAEEMEFVGDSADGDGNDMLKNVDMLANIRLFSTFLNKSEELEFSTLLSKVETLLSERLNEMKNQDEVEADTGRVSPAEEAIHVLATNESGIQCNLKHVIDFFMWTVKALAMRGYASLDIWIQNKTVRMLKNSSYGHLVADGFSTLMSDSLESLNASSFCNYRLLYKQRIFQLSIPCLVQGYTTTKDESRANYIRALTAQLRFVPQVVLQMELSNVIPLLVGSLTYEIPAEDEKEKVIISRNANNASLLVSALNALLELLTSTEGNTSGGLKESPLLSYVMDLTPRLVNLSRYKGFMKVRILSIKCLQRCASFPTLAILPMKEKVVSALRPCLDDPKRLVRKEAVQCRNIWILVGAPGGL